MTEGKISKSILLFALPIMGGLLLQMLYNTVDGIVVGNFVGERALAAVNTSGSFANLLLALANGISGGSGVYLAQLYGAKEKEKLHRSMATMILLMLGLGLAVSVLGELLAVVVLKGVLQVPAEVYDWALMYLRIYLLGMCFQFVYNGLAAALRSVGDSKAAMLMLIMSSVANIILDLLFVIAFGWGVSGVAIATVIAQLAAVIGGFIYIKKKRPLLAVDVREFSFETGTALIFLKAGIPMAIQFIISNMGAIAVQRLVNSYGAGFMAAVAAAGKIEQYAVVPIMSFAQTMTVFTGQNVGAGKLKRAKEGLHITWVMSLFGCLILAMVLIFLARPLIMLFGCRGETLEIGVKYLHFIPFILAFAVFQFTTRCFLQGAGDITFPMIITFVTLGLRVISAYMMASTPIGYRAVWMATGVDFAFGGLLNIIRMRTGKWKTMGLVKKG